MLNSFLYNIKEAFQGMVRNRSMALASIASVTSSLFVFGVMLCIVLNLNNITAKTQDQFNAVNVYLSDDLNESRQQEIGMQIKSMDNVAAIHYESKEQALQKLRERWGEKAYLLDGIENPLQNAYIVEIKDAKKADKLVAGIGSIAGVEETRYYKDIIDQLSRMVNTINRFGLALMAVLVFVSIFIISTTIRLTINARKNEIFIMKYMGATNWFVRWPFIIEGLILGFIGALIAIGLTNVMYHVMYDFITTDNVSFITGYILRLEDIFSNIAAVFLAMGIGIGTVGSVASVRQYLEV
ncbi:MAG: permease-like cell division protein FtsX [Peptostreptococcaceae bacterium]|nr:permease-like cell division protein FtsX [Peptostreptococcaceae bacterium]